MDMVIYKILFNLNEKIRKNIWESFIAIYYIDMGDD